MATLGKLNLIADKAKRDKRLQFTSLVHLVNESNLAQCFKDLKRDRACGIDGVTVDEYGARLQGNISDLVVRLKTKTYKPQPVRRVYIPKPGKAEKRPLGIPAVEDKLVQMMVKKILEPIYEADFLDVSFGFRPNRSCHDAINRLDKEVMTKPVNFIVEVDIRKFFDNVNHYWLLRCLEERIKDPNLLLLVRKLLKAGAVDDGVFQASDVGTPQGGVASPLFANIYLHYVLDLWFTKVIKPKSSGYMELIRYCDDFVVCCESKRDAEEFLSVLRERLAKFGLSVAEEKTRVVEFGRQAWQKSRRHGTKVGTFTFLGFTHFCATSQRGKFIMGHKTSKDNLQRKLLETKSWLRAIRNIAPLKEWWPVLKAKLSGHYAYFGISGNLRCLQQFYHQVVSLTFKWMNRRSQKKSMNWQKYMQYLEWHPLPTPRIVHSIYTLSPNRGKHC